MSDTFDFASVGGVAYIQSGADPLDPNSILWNFGVANPGVEVAQSVNAPSLYEMFPKLRGKWDGTSTVNHHAAVRRVLGKFLPAHQQPKGTCGGRSFSRTLELLQCVLIAAGKRAKYHDVSHAWGYFLARREHNMLGGGDGVADGSIPPMMAKYGALTREEAGDSLWAGPRSDDLAAAWGGGRLRGDELERLTKLASDNIATVSAKVRSAAELADGIAAGGVASCSDMQGYSMTRDRDGFCKPQGQWAHYHVRSGVIGGGRRGFVYDQSWGDTTPEGPELPGCPGNCFGVDWDVQDRLCKNGSVHVVFGFDPWDLENDNLTIDWIV
jgi:hypothetical protein